MTSPTPPSEPAETRPVAGWYPDVNEGKLRYWDGNGWTEHLAPYPDDDPGAPPPPNAGDAVDLAAPGTKMRPMAEWLSETFKLVIDSAGHLFTLIVILTLAVDLATAAATWFAVQDLVVTITDGEAIDVTGADAWLAVAIIAVLLSLVSKIVLASSAAHHVLAARTGVPESWSDTLGETMSRIPRVLGSTLLFVGAFTVLYLGVVLVLGIVVAVAPFLQLFAIVGAFIGLLAGCTRIGFGPVMAVVAPVGEGGIRRSIALTKGSTRDLLRRFSMLALIGFTMMVIASLFTAPLLAGDAELVSGNDVIDFSKVFGDHPGAFGLGQVISGLVASAFTVLLGGGLGLLYADLGGAVDESITNIDPDGAAAPSA